MGYRKAPFDIKAEFLDPSKLPPLTSKELGKFRVELPVQPVPKKVKVKTKLTLHGTFSVEGAQIVEEEEYEETVKERRELPPEEVSDEEAEEEPTAATEEKENADTQEDGGDAKKKDETKKEEKAEEPDKEADKTEDAKETETPAAEPAPEEAKKEEGSSKKKRKEPEKRYEWVDVVKKKRRIKRTDISVVASGRPGLDEATLQKRQDEETALQVEMCDIIETDERRNDLESYIFRMRDKTSTSGEYGEFISDADREKFSSDLLKAEDWLYDTPDATKVQFVDKLTELKTTGDQVAWRFKENAAAQDADKK